jgi:hypothetical protein
MSAAGDELPSAVTTVVDHIYELFGGYRCPEDLWVCPQCGPHFSARDICSTPRRSLSFSQFDAVHVMSLDDDVLRYFFPRLVELLLREPSPSFDFRLSRLKGRVPAWTVRESAIVRKLVETVWRELLIAYPASLGYLSDIPSMLNFTNWCDMSLTPFLDAWQTNHRLPSTMHLADLIYFFFTTADPFEPDVNVALRSWLARPEIGDWLQDAFLSADSGPAANQLADAHELWSVCAQA